MAASIGDAGDYVHLLRSAEADQEKYAALANVAVLQAWRAFCARDVAGDHRWSWNKQVKKFGITVQMLQMWSVGKRRLTGERLQKIVTFIKENS